MTCPASDWPIWPASCLARSGSEIAGPDGESGRLYAIDDSVRIRYAPDQQTWRRGPGGKYWLGYDNAAKPTPASLRYSDAIQAYP